MSSAEKYTPQYTVVDYQLWEGDWELWAGSAVAMTPSPFGRHSKLLVDIVTEFNLAIREAKCDATVLAEIDWVISNNTVLRPDVTVVCGDAPERHVEAPPAVVVEVLSASTRERDLTFKRQIYEQQKVPWYLILDPDNNTLLALRLDADGEYQAVTHDDTLNVDICGECSLAVQVGRVFE